jgi:hypothetical protein
MIVGKQTLFHDLKFVTASHTRLLIYLLDKKYIYIMLSTLSPRLFFSLKTTAKPRVIHPIFRKMSTMKAVLVEEQGPIENMLYKDVAIPKATGKNIVVKNRFAGKLPSPRFS